jgi:hypothetical protein
MTSGTVETTGQLAGLATEQWDDLHFRHYLGDTGKYPTSGVLSGSPDIIPLGRVPVADPQYLIDGGNWATDFGGATYASEPNYIYLRGQNLSAGAATGKLYLYYSPASLLLWPTDPLDPSKGWAKHPLKTDRGAQWIDVSAGSSERFCTLEPFRWIPAPIHNDHYCMIARLVTERHPNEIPAVGTLTDFAAYISQHPNMAWRNVVTINPSSAVTTRTVNYSQGSEGGVVYINLNCTYVPDGSAVSFSSGTPGPKPLIHKEKTTVRNEVDDDGVPHFTVTVRTTIPANWTSDISYTWYSEGKTPLGGMEVELDAVMPAYQDDPVLGAVSRPLSDFGIADAMIPADGPRRGIRLGSAIMRTQRVAATGYGPNGDKPEPASASSVLFSGVSWAEKHSSIFGNWTDTHDVTVQREDKTDVVTFTDTATGESGEQQAADATLDARLSTGPYTGPAFAVLTTENVPVGCNVWFRNLDGPVKIAIQPARVDNAAEFTVTAKVASLPADYSAKVRAYLQLEGHDLPPAARLTFSIFELVTAGERGPVPGKLLGAVTLKP